MSDFNPFSDAPQSFERELIPEGPHAARCVRVIEIGKQYSQLYDSPDMMLKVANDLAELFKDSEVVEPDGDVVEEKPLDDLLLF